MIDRLIPIVLIAAAVWGYVGFTRPMFADVADQNARIQERRSTLENIEKVKTRLDALKTAHRSIGEDKLKKLDMMLPEKIENIHLAVDVNSLSKAYGFTVSAIDAGMRPMKQDSPSDPSAAPLPYAPVTLKFEFQGSYESLVAFLSDLEKSVRIVDLDSLGLTSVQGMGGIIPGLYGFSLSMKAYQFMP